MDPVTIATTCVGLIGTVAQLLSQMHRFVSDFRDTRKDLEAVTAELQSLSMCLECLRNDYSNERVSYPDNISESLFAILENCNRVTGQMKALLDQTSSQSVGKKLNWAMHGRQQMNTLRSNLEAHKSAINIALDMTTAVVVSAVAKQTTNIERDTNEIKQDCAKIELVLDEIQALRSQLRQPDWNTNNNYLLDRFLSESCSYAESVVNVTDVEDSEASFLPHGRGTPEPDESGAFHGELRDMHLFCTPGRSRKVPLAEGKIFAAQRARRLQNDVMNVGVNKNFATILLERAHDSKLHLVRLEAALDAGADVNLKVQVELPQCRWHRHRRPWPVEVSPLGAEICLNKSTPAVALLLSRGADLSHPSILALAAQSGDYQVLDFILKQGVDPNQLAPEDWPDAYKGGGLILLCRERALRLLLEAGADVNQAAYYGESALFTAVFFGVKEYVDILLAHGASVFVRGGSFGTVLQTAVASPRPSLACIEELLDRGCPVNETGGYHGTALSAAAAQGHVDVVRLLLQAGADPKETAGTGKDPQYWLGRRNQVNPRRGITDAEVTQIREMLFSAAVKKRALAN